MNTDLLRLQPYPFEKLAELKQGLQPPAQLDHIALSIGEPRHPAPRFVIDNLIAHLHQLSNYPSTRGSAALREAIASWVIRRFAINPGLVDPETNLLPVSGTREALFAIAQTVIDRQAERPLVLMPNPFYQIYEGAALLAGASPCYLNCLSDNDFLPDLDEIDDARWADCQMLYICTPGNPSGAVMPRAYLRRLIELAHRHDFVIASDECYSEIYFDEDEPPPGLLGIAAEIGNEKFERCLAFHSLSKRSNLPGLRSGFVAGDAQILQRFLLYRTYHGCALPPATQSASAAAWSDEAHVIENRALYRQKFEQVLALLSDTLAPQKPQAGFYLWASTPVSDTEFTQRLYAEQNVTVLPGRFLSRDQEGVNPGENRVRMALVAPLDECLDAARRINQLIPAL
ncbi:MAG: succinyldiaminopimelate transaminase [Gammaproteobacteria bacterium]|nr:succinyldiaminopimelate transaminase [Gammaproteobacteria bacterium]MDH3534954.1 succinyldiaminopimelate transaminase [Gammaproteobacteria bacterium]